MKKLLSMLCLLGWALCSFSQKNGFLLHDIKLPESFSDRVISLAEKDNAGLLWLVANDGLYRYDGNEIIQFNRESNPSIPQNSVTALCADQQNNLWVGTNDGLICFDLSAWITTPVKVKNVDTTAQASNLNISCIKQGIDGTIYAGTRDGKLYRVAGDSLVILLDIQQDYPNRYHDPIIDAIHEPFPGEIWLSASIERLIRIKVNNGLYAPAEYINLESDDAVIDDMCMHSSGKALLAVSEHGIFTYDARTGALELIRDQQGRNLGKGSDFFVDMLTPNEAILITNNPAIGKDKLYVYNFLTDTLVEETLHYPDYMRDNRIKWTRNTENALLFSLDSRIMELIPSAGIFKSYLTDATALSSIRSIYKKPGGPLYAGSYKHGFVRVDETTGKMEILSPEFVYSMLPWNSDTLLLATEGAGLLWYEQEANRFSPLHVQPQEKGARSLGNFLTILRRGKDHQILVGGYEGLALVDPYAKTFRDIGEDRLGRLKIFSLVNVGDRWIIGTSQGIVEWDSKTDAVRSFLKDVPESDNPYPVYCLARANKQIWMGTHGDGIIVTDIEGNILDTIDNAQGLSNNIIYSLVANGPYVIAGTNTGLSIINAETGNIRNYFRKDQLPADEFNGAAAFMTGNTVYLGTVNGILRFNIDSLNLRERQELSIPIHITNLTTEDTNVGIWYNYSLPYTSDSTLLIDPGVRYFSIAFGGLDNAARQLEYHYRLNDQGEWHAIGRQREISFVEMPPGSYQLQLAARLPDGQWTKSLLQVPLIIQPTFQQTIWFKLLVIGAIALIIWGIFKYRENIQLKEKKLRVKIAGDLHDEVGSSLTRIYFQADMLSNQALPMPKDREQLQKIADNSQIALLTMSDMVWSIDARYDTMNDLIIRMKDYLYKLKEELDISYSFNQHGDHDKFPLSQIIRQNLFLIFKEALSNAIKHGNGSKITIELDVAHRVRLEIHNGYASESAAPVNYQGGRGIQSMQQRAAAMKGELNIAQNNGEFCLKLRIFS